jgi:hypothetical protein
VRSLLVIVLFRATCLVERRWAYLKLPVEDGVRYVTRWMDLRAARIGRYRRLPSTGSGLYSMVSVAVIPVVDVELVVFVGGTGDVRAVDFLWMG